MSTRVNSISKLPGDDEVREALRKRADDLFEEKWFDDTCKVERVRSATVSAHLSHHIKGLKKNDNLFRLGYSYVKSSRDLAEYKQLPAEFYAAAAAPICITVVTLILAFKVNYAYLLGLYASAIACFVPLLVLVRSRRHRGIANAPAESLKAATDVDRGIRSIIERSVREVTRPHFVVPSKNYVKIGDGAKLSSRVTETERIITRYRPSIELHMLRSGGAVVGVTGERGTGKSELLKSFCDSSVGKATLKGGGTIGVFVAVPAAFKGLEFLSLVAERLAQQVPGYRTQDTYRIRRRLSILIPSLLLGFISYVLGLVLVSGGATWKLTATEVGAALLVASLILIILSAVLFMDMFFWLRVSKGSVSSGSRKRSGRAVRSRIGRDAERLVQRLRYAETTSAGTEGSASWGGVGLKRSRQRSLSSLPLTEASLVSEIKGLADRLAYVGYRIVIGVDEMDKLDAGEATEEFLNSVKQLFSISSCSFLVSVSSSAWTRFVQRGINMRDALDSSLDAIEPVGSLNFLETRSLILHRGEDMSDSEILFCYALSGGLPREAMRSARSLAMRNRDEEGGSHTLDAVAGRVLKMEFERLVAAIKGEFSALEFDSRDTMFRAVDEVAWSWESTLKVACADVAESPSESDSRTAPTDGLVGEAKLTIVRLELMAEFFSAMNQIFCTPLKTDKAIKYWEGEALAVCGSLSNVRRLIEADPTAARRSLLEINHKLGVGEAQSI